MRLVPLTSEHLADLFAAGGGDDDVWRWQGGPTPHTQAELGRKLRTVLEAAERGQRSQDAITRPGAKREGSLRRHRQRPDGSWRDTAYFSMLADEWPAAKARLCARADRLRRPVTRSRMVGRAVWILATNVWFSQIHRGRLSTSVRVCAWCQGASAMPALVSALLR